MNRRWTIRNVSDETKAKALILCAAKGIFLSELLEELVNGAWNQDETEVSRRVERKMKRIIERYPYALLNKEEK